MHGQNCLRRQISKGKPFSYNSAITPVIVCPGRSEVMAVPPECLMPQDGHDKQDGEQGAGKRWMDKHAKQVAPHGVTCEPAAFIRMQQVHNPKNSISMATLMSKIDVAVGLLD
jgi:hypothetical protein